MKERNFFIIVIFCGLMLGPIFYFMRVNYVKNNTGTVESIPLEQSGKSNLKTKMLERHEVDPKLLETHEKYVKEQLDTKE